MMVLFCLGTLPVRTEREKKRDFFLCVFRFLLSSVLFLISEVSTTGWLVACMMQSFGGIEIICPLDHAAMSCPSITLCLSVEELKQSLVATTVELEAAKEELKKKEQSIAKLADLVHQVAKERDQLQHLLLSASKPAPTPPPQPPLVTSSVTDSDCSLVSSPVDPFFDPVTSSDNRCKLSSPPPAKQSASASADAVLDMLAKKRPLPQRGRLLQSVMEAGPLLQNLLVAGLLPRWRNPPPVHKLDTLPVGVRGGGSAYGAPLAGTNATAVLGYDGVSACMKRPMAVMCTPTMAMAATNCSPGFSAKRHRLY